MTTPPPPPEAQLIARLRNDMVPPLSMREAARRAGFSAATWTGIEQGYRKVTSKIVLPIRGTDEKLARMAIVVGAKPGQLRDAGRGGAADMLARLISAGPDPIAQTIEVVRASRDLTAAQKAKLIELLEQDRG